ncbi:MAG: hypothetical protein ABI852_03475 [Gemmatimonadaceae bacterium]
MRPFIRSFRHAVIVCALTPWVLVACSSASQGGTTKSGVTSPASGANANGAPSLALVTEGFSASVRADVEKLRIATAPYHDVKVAQTAGYPTTTPACVADSTMGGMGRHFLDRAAYDEKLDIAHPEMLIYAPSAGGLPDHLVGVEYVIPFRLLPSTEKPPRLFGQELKRHEDFKYWYLHVWAWKKNSAGLFSDWDPSITCGA